MPNPFRLERKLRHARPPRPERKLRLARPPWARMQAPSSPTPWPRTQALSRPSSESRMRSSPLPKPQHRAQSTLRPSLGLRVRLSAHDGRTSDVTRTMPPMLQQGMPATISTTPVTVQPYLFHCGALPYSKRMYGEG